MKYTRVFAGAGAAVLVLAVGSGVSSLAPSDSPAPGAPTIEESSSDSGADSAEGGNGDGAEPSEYAAFEATAYCDFGITYSGVLVRRGMVAADPRILPIGSVIEVVAGHYSGIYTVMDTGGVVKGRIIDIYLPDYEEAIQFGRQTVQVRVLRRGWHPDAAPDLEYSLSLAG
jgi:3D (Asp-Asp-Asp) domain-containing protein